MHISPINYLNVLALLVHNFYIPKKSSKTRLNSQTMSYPAIWKKNNEKGLRLDIKSDLKQTKSEALDLSENKSIAKSERSYLFTESTRQHQEDNSKNGEPEKSDFEQNKPGKRNPKCARCANHKPVAVPVKGHKRKCPFRECLCRLCNLTVERRELMAKTIREKRKQKEDLADDSYTYNEPIFPKKSRTDESSSETDRESGYGTEEIEKLKPNDIESDDELKKCVDKYVPIILRQLLDHKMTPLEIGQTLIALYLKDNMSSIIRQKSNPSSITNRIIEASKQLTSNPLTNISPVVPLPLTPLTPNSLSVMMSPPSSASSTGSVDSPNPESFKGPDPNLFQRNFFHPYLSPFGPNPYLSVRPLFPNHSGLAGL